MALPGRLVPVHGKWEPRTVAAVRRILRPGMTAVDVGAHIGYFTTLFSELVGPSGSVWAFEPHPRNHAVLVENARAANVECVAAAVSDRDAADVPLYPGHDSGGHTLTRRPAPVGGRQPLPVRTCRLDTFWEQRARPPVDLVKVDVEGFEPEVLAGADELLRANGGVRLIVEYHPRALRARGMDPGELLRRLDRIGCVAEVLDGDDDDIDEVRDGYVNLLCARDGVA